MDLIVIWRKILNRGNEKIRANYDCGISESVGCKMVTRKYEKKLDF